MASIFDKATETVKVYRDDKNNGRINAIPPPFPSLADHFPGWERAKQTTISAGTGIGKTKLAKFFIITSIAKYIHENPDLDVTIRWYALEETEQEFALSFISTILAVKYGIILSVPQLLSIGKYTLSKVEEEAVEDATIFLNEFLKHVHVIDWITNPYGIWKDVREFTEKRGKFYYEKVDKNNKVISCEEITDPTKGWNKFVPTREKEFVFIVTDHISLLQPEKDHHGSLFAAMGEFSKKYCLKFMVKRLGYHVINIQQQTADSDKQQFDFKGQSIEAKLLPTLDGLANNKECARDCHLVMAIFAPTRYGLEKFDGYNINPNTGGLGDKYRCLLFLKDRNYGLANARVHMFFNGALNYLEELPPWDTMTPDKYKKLLTIGTLTQ
jgi:hypothetical protein